MAAYKLNVLKLHLTDYEGWRLEIPAYPKLTQVGSLVDGKPQYFTTADMREIVQYAAERHIMVVPEIEMPGHAGAAARSYPEFFDKDGSASIRRTRRPTTSSAAFLPKSPGCSPRRTWISPATRLATRRGREWLTSTGSRPSKG